MKTLWKPIAWIGGKLGHLAKIIVVFPFKHPFIMAIFFAVALIAGGALYFGFGRGSFSDAPLASSAVDPEESKPEETPEPKDTNLITIDIIENQVFVDGTEYKTPDELKKYLEEVNDDRKTFQLNAAQSILETYIWVANVFHELQIPFALLEE